VQIARTLCALPERARCARRRGVAIDNANPRASNRQARRGKKMPPEQIISATVCGAFVGLYLIAPHRSN
jgi:hypothetical protein